MMTMAPVPLAEFERQQKKSVKFKRTNSDILMSIDFPPIRWIVEGYVSEGLAILAGRQKLGKTWLALDWALAVACGSFAMGSIECEKGNVLYIDMENGHRRIQGRINVLFPDPRTRPDLSNLEWVNEAPNLDKGFLDALEDWRLSVANPRLVVIDVLQRVKPTGKANQNSYESDYAALEGLQRWATAQRIAVICLHHTRKGGADDPLEAISGSNGLSACADTTLLLDRNGNGITLYVRGRDVEEKERALTFAGGIWNVTGDASDVRRSSERSNILAVLERSPEPMAPGLIADVTGMRSGNVRRLLHSMLRDGEVHRSGRGLYGHVKPSGHNDLLRESR